MTNPNGQDNEQPTPASLPEPVQAQLKALIEQMEELSQAQHKPKTEQQRLDLSSIPWLARRQAAYNQTLVDPATRLDRRLVALIVGACLLSGILGSLPGWFLWLNLPPPTGVANHIDTPTPTANAAAYPVPGATTEPVGGAELDPNAEPTVTPTSPTSTNTPTLTSTPTLTPSPTLTPISTATPLDSASPLAERIAVLPKTDALILYSNASGDEEATYDSVLLEAPADFPFIPVVRCAEEDGRTTIVIPTTAQIDCTNPTGWVDSAQVERRPQPEESELALISGSFNLYSSQSTSDMTPLTTTTYNNELVLICDKIQGGRYWIVRLRSNASCTTAIADATQGASGWMPSSITANLITLSLVQ